MIKIRFLQKICLRLIWANTKSDLRLFFFNFFYLRYGYIVLITSIQHSGVSCARNEEELYGAVRHYKTQERPTFQLCKTRGEATSGAPTTIATCSWAKTFSRTTTISWRASRAKSVIGVHCNFMLQTSFNVINKTNTKIKLIYNTCHFRLSSINNLIMFFFLGKI